MKLLTPRQSAVLDYIKRSIEENGCAPRHADIASQFNFSIRAAAFHLLALQKKKKIFVQFKKTRGIQVLS